MPKILLVEDDDAIRETVLYTLLHAGFDATGFENGKDFFVSLEKEESLPDLVILDIMLPGEDGLAILKKMRQNPKYSEIPVIMLTAKGSEMDKVKGFDLGADDYITKPFSVMEFVARIKAILRRSGRSGTDTKGLEYKNIRIDNEKRVVLVDGEVVSLTYKEYELLHYFMMNMGIALSRDKILQAVWGYDSDSETRTVDAHMSSLRLKLGKGGDCIKTLRNVGYKLGD